MVRTPAKKAALGLSIISLLCAAISLVVFVYQLTQRGVTDTWSASLFAITVFFVSCAVVLFFMSKPPRYELRPWNEKEEGQ